MKFKLITALLAIAAGAGLLIFKQPTLDDRLAKLEPELSKKLDAREVQIDPAELLDIIYNNNIGLRIIDVREEADYNLFHIIDSVHAAPDRMRDPEWVKKLPEKTVMVLVSNDEKRASQAWKILSAQRVQNLDILEGGINHWLSIYDAKEKAAGPEKPLPCPKCDDTLRHRFTAALGSMHPASDPDPKRAPQREYTQKVKSIGTAGRKTGGCG